MGWPGVPATVDIGCTMICLSAGSLSPKTGTAANVTGSFLGGTTAGGPPGGTAGVTPPAGAGDGGRRCRGRAGGPGRGRRRTFREREAAVPDGHRLRGDVGCPAASVVRVVDRDLRGAADQGAEGRRARRGRRRGRVDGVARLAEELDAHRDRDAGVARPRHVVGVGAAAVALGGGLAGRVRLVVERLRRARGRHRHALGDRAHDRRDDPVADRPLQGQDLLRGQALERGNGGGGAGGGWRRRARLAQGVLDQGGSGARGGGGSRHGPRSGASSRNPCLPMIGPMLLHLPSTG